MKSSFSRRNVPAVLCAAEREDLCFIVLYAFWCFCCSVSGYNEALTLPLVGRPVRLGCPNYRKRCLLRDRSRDLYLLGTTPEKSTSAVLTV
jgi:hypothetical protein